MKKLTAVVVATALVSFAYGGEEKVNLKTIKDKKMIKCLADYMKKHKTKATMIINEKGERELHIPKKYVEECKKQLSHSH
ncbi:MAG: hypothetical protein GXN94_04410 [Aquificae bacterium]|nr:hypothetical protein [Aquificota bacterium]